MRARTPLAAMLPALLLAALVATGRQAAAEELLVNGDFSQDGNGWTAYGLGFDTGCSGHNAPPAAGLHLDHSGEGRLVSGAVPIEPGGTYEASGYARFLAGADPVLRIGVAFYETADGAGLPSQENVSPALALPADDYSPINVGGTARRPAPRCRRQPAAQRSSRWR